ncbi:MAG: hypothetical protein M3Z03_12250 [Actinomycetota bacterium]|nr:hypothetical protein [Actinomycetota bacterium]
MTTQGVSRALVGEPLLVRPYESEERPGEAIGTAAVLGVGVGAVLGVAGLITAAWNQELGFALGVLAACTPLLVLQDLGRYLAFALQVPSRALILDLSWLVLQIVAVSVLALTDTATLVWFIAAWAGAGAVSGGILIWEYRKARIRPTLNWLKETWPFSWRYTISFAARQGAVLLASSTLAGVLGSRSLGALRGSLLLYGPLVQIQAASIAAGVSEVARIDRTSPDLRRHVVRTTSITTGIAAANLVVLLLLPDRLGELVLGDTWEGAQRLLLPAGLQMVAVGLISGVRSALLGLGATREALRVDIATAAAMFGSTILGSLLWDVLGVVWTTCAAQVLLMLLWWTVYTRRVRRPFTPPIDAPGQALGHTPSPESLAP